MSAAREYVPLRENRFGLVWGRLVFAAMFLLLPFVYADIYAHAGLAPGRLLAAARPERWAWWAYAAFQVANKLPIAYRYAPSPPALVAFDLLGYGVGLAAVCLHASGSAVPAGPLRSAALAVVAAWVTVGLWYQLKRLGAMPTWQRIYLAIVSSLVPNVPFAAALLIAPGVG